MFRDRFLKRLFFIAFIMVVILPAMLGRLGKINPVDPLGQAKPPVRAAVVTEQRKIHILYGDATGGGHLYGMNKPCTSEFPPEWRADDIIARVTAHAANDNLGWKKQKNGNYAAEAADRGLKIRIVVNADRTEVVTAYPVNVKRNPCGKAVNDN